MNRIRIRLQTSLLVIAFLIAGAVGPSGPALAGAAAAERIPNRTPVTQPEMRQALENLRALPRSLGSRLVLCVYLQMHETRPDLAAPTI